MAAQAELGPKVLSKRPMLAPLMEEPGDRAAATGGVSNAWALRAEGAGLDGTRPCCAPSSPRVSDESGSCEAVEQGRAVL
jgi:hypothetical protein